MKTFFNIVSNSAKSWSISLSRRKQFMHPKHTKRRGTNIVKIYYYFMEVYCRQGGKVSHMVQLLAHIVQKRNQHRFELANKQLNYANLRKHEISIISSQPCIVYRCSLALLPASTFSILFEARYAAETGIQAPSALCHAC